jgi:hypothetical protein
MTRTLVLLLALTSVCFPQQQDTKIHYRLGLDSLPQ